MIRRHVLRNSLLPTITVIATQTGYLIGGLVLVETLFHYNGIGSLIFTAANQKDFPMLEAGVLVDRHRLHGGDAGRRHPVHAAQPADPLSGASNERRRRPGRVGRRRQRRRAPTSAAGSSSRELAALADVHRRRGHPRLLDPGGDLRQPDRPQDPLAQNLLNINQAPSGAHCSAPTSSAATCSPGSSSARGTSSSSRRWRRCWGRCSAPCSAWSWATSAARSTTSSAASSRRSWRSRWCHRASSVVAVGSSDLTLIVVIGIVFTPLIARTVRAAVLVERELDYVAAARLRGERSLLHHVRRDPAQHHRPRSWSSSRSASATRCSRS